MKTLLCAVLAVLCGPMVAYGSDYVISIEKVTAVTRDGKSTGYVKLINPTVRIGKSIAPEVRLDGPEIHILQSEANANAVCARLGMGSVKSYDTGIWSDDRIYVNLESDGSSATVQSRDEDGAQILMGLICKQ